MKTYISILRGINVSGQKLIKMDALKKAYENVGFRNVTTYVQSGNVIFSASETEPEKLEQMIYSRIEKDFGFEVPVIVLTDEKLKQVVDNNPFVNDPGKEPTFLYVSFLSSKPAKFDSSVIEAKKLDGEEISFAGEAVYLFCPNGYGRTKLNNNFLESKLKVTATTRNWKTTNELLKMAQQIKRAKSTNSVKLQDIKTKIMKRYGQIIGVKAETIEEYKKYHAAVWPEVLAKITECNIRNYSIFNKDGLLFAYFEYVGTDFAADMAKMAADPTTQKWWSVMEPMQQPVDNRQPGEWWANMQEVFHLD